MHSLPAPHPARASGAPPSPHPGRGPCPGVYQVSSRIRGVAGRPPCPALLQDLPMCWTVGISPLGVGLTGRGNSFPLPCLPRSKYLTSAGISPHPRLRQRIPIPFCRQPPPCPRLRQKISIRFCRHPHPARACGAPPPPHPGRGQCPGVYQVSSRIRGFSRISPCAGPWGYHGWWWGQRGGGTCSPSPVSSSPDTVIHVVPTPPAPPGSSHEADRAAIAMRRGGPPLPADGHL